jgi:protein-tyrosine phosphatase
MPRCALQSVPMCRLLVLAGVLLLSGCAYFSKHTAEGACPDSLGSPIRNFCVEGPGLWRGERPTRSDATWLLQHGVATVVNLEVFLSDRFAFDRATAPAATHQVQYFHIPDFEPVHLVNWSLLDKHVARFIAIVQQAPKPIYVHCLDGLDRTGVLIAAYRVVVGGVDDETAIAEMARYGTPWVRVDARYIRSLRGARRAAILREVAASEAHLKPSARIDCDGRVCRYSSGWPRDAVASADPPPTARQHERVTTQPGGVGYGPGGIRTHDQGIHSAPAFPPGVDYLFTRAR